MRHEPAHAEKSGHPNEYAWELHAPVWPHGHRPQGLSCADLVPVHYRGEVGARVAHITPARVDHRETPVPQRRLALIGPEPRTLHHSGVPLPVPLLGAAALAPLVRDEPRGRLRGAGQHRLLRSGLHVARPRGAHRAGAPLAGRRGGHLAGARARARQLCPDVLRSTGLEQRHAAGLAAAGSGTLVVRCERGVELLLREVLRQRRGRGDE
mmetsp:Transcript_43975/g.118184  ORF Transcript_43975/g.118184 Transcript_43975/m.118184 type:complete len:210 (-) Transcript_43975:110-739(-)